jgi:ribosome-associated protein
LDTLELAHTIVEALEERKGEDILILEIKELTLLGDYFVICSGTSPRMLEALEEAVVEAVKKRYRLRPRVEGEARDGWILADYGEVIVHIFAPERRAYYALEDLWRDGRVILRVQ